MRGSSVKRIDARILFDPAVEQLHVPAGTAELRYGQRREMEVVGEKNEPQGHLGIEVVKAPQRNRIALGGLGSGERNHLAGYQSGGFVDRTGLSPVELRVLLGTGNEESQGLGENTGACEIQVAPVEQVESAQIGQELAEEFDIVDLALRHVSTGGNAVRASSSVCALPALLRQRNCAHGAVHDGSPRDDRVGEPCGA